MPLTPIESLDDIYTYLYAAMQLEHATIPTYLTALYSIHPGTNSDATQVIRVVAVEEMLHLTLAANLMNATGGTVDLTQPGFVPTFPTYLPDGETDFEVSREKFSRDALNTFLLIERPASTKNQYLLKRGEGLVHRSNNRINLLPSCSCETTGEELSFYSIGEFYHAIELGLEKLCDELGEDAVFSGDRNKQITPQYYYSGGGEVIPVYDLKSAKEAIDLISEQGEGFEGSITDDEGEISHYYRFQQLVNEQYYLPGDKPNQPTGSPLKVDWEAVYPVKKNVTVADLEEGSEVHAAAVKFNMQYKGFLASLTQAFSGQPEILLKSVGDMFHIKDKALELMRNPISGSGENAAPTFEIH